MCVLLFISLSPLTDLLQQVHALGKTSKNVFTAAQNFSLAQGGDCSSSPSVSFKAHLIRLIGNLCHGNTANQNKVWMDVWKNEKTNNWIYCVDPQWGKYVLPPAADIRQTMPTHRHTAGTDIVQIVDKTWVRGSKIKWLTFLWCNTIDKLHFILGFEVYSPSTGFVCERVLSE